MRIETNAAHAGRIPASGRTDAPQTAPQTAQRSAVGARRSTPAVRRAEALADGWAGLPEGVTRWRLAAALRAAARALDLTSPMLRLLEHYVDVTYDQDWASDSEPVICRPLAEIAEHMGLGERQLRNIERALVERGLLAFRDSGNHARRGRRDRKTGRLVYAYGPSLAPLGVRAQEIVALAAAARAEIAEGRRLRLAVSALRRRLRADLAAAEAAGFDAAGLRAGLDAAPARLPAAMGPQALRSMRDALAGLAACALDLLGGACPVDPQTPDDGEASSATPCTSDVKITGPQAIDAAHYTDTSKKYTASGLSIPLTKVKTAAGRGEATKAPIAAGAAPTIVAAGAAVRRDHGVGAIPLAVALAAAGPEIAALARTGAGQRGWPALIDAARSVAPLLGVEQGLWGEACGRLGRGGATLALIILERGATRPVEEGEPIRRPAAYLRELLVRADRAELHLDRSIRALAARPCAWAGAPPRLTPNFTPGGAQAAAPSPADGC